MAPGALSILAPFLGRGKAKKYEKLETEDPERRRQEATQEEINRLNCKIVSYTFRNSSCSSGGEKDRCFFLWKSEGRLRRVNTCSVRTSSSCCCRNFFTTDLLAKIRKTLFFFLPRSFQLVVRKSATTRKRLFFLSHRCQRRG